MARRTIYVHFAGRTALVEGLIADAGEAIRLAVTVAKTPSPDPVSALAQFVLTLWPVGDRYRTLIALACRDLGADRLSELLSPARDTVAGILTLGQRHGVFHASVPPGPSAEPSKHTCWHSWTASTPGPGPTTAPAPPPPR